MDKLTVDRMESSKESIGQEASGCPMHAMHTPTAVNADDEIVIPKRKRVVTRYSSNAAGEMELHFDYGEKEIVFDDPELLAFGEALARQSRFVAKTAPTWGEGFDWPRVRELLEQIIAEGILRHTDECAKNRGFFVLPDTDPRKGGTKTGPILPHGF